LSTAAELREAVDALPAIQLIKLQDSAALLSRRERKYLVPVSVAASLVAAVSSEATALEIDGERSFRYESIYFDTPGGASYLAAARRRRRAYKIRTRTYIDSGECVLEVKLRGSRGRTIKSRVDYPTAASGDLNLTARQFISQILGTSQETDLQPTLKTTYQRSTLRLSGDSRLTIDIDFVAAAPEGDRVTLEGFAIIESKSRSAPTVADRTLWRMGYRPIRLSKFGTSLAVMDPLLPSNRWRRALRSPWAGRRHAIQTT